MIPDPKDNTYVHASYIVINMFLFLELEKEKDV